MEILGGVLQDTVHVDRKIMGLGSGNTRKDELPQKLSVIIDSSKRRPYSSSNLACNSSELSSMPACNTFAMNPPAGSVTSTR